MLGTAGDMDIDDLGLGSGERESRQRERHEVAALVPDNQTFVFPEVRLEAIRPEVLHSPRAEDDGARAGELLQPLVRRRDRRAGVQDVHVHEQRRLRGDRHRDALYSKAACFGMVEVLVEGVHHADGVLVRRLAFGAEEQEREEVAVRVPGGEEGEESVEPLVREVAKRPPFSAGQRLQGEHGEEHPDAVARHRALQIASSSR